MILPRPRLPPPPPLLNYSSVGDEEDTLLVAMSQLTPLLFIKPFDELPIIASIRVSPFENVKWYGTETLTML